MNLNAQGIVRLFIYIVSALMGLAAVVAPVLGYADLGAALGTVAGALAAVSGATATYHLPKADDQPGGGLDLNAAVAAYPVITRAIQDYQKRDVPRETGSTPVTAADEYGRHAAKTTSTGEDIPPLPIYRGESSAS